AGLIRYYGPVFPRGEREILFLDLVPDGLFTPAYVTSSCPFYVAEWTASISPGHTAGERFTTDGRRGRMILLDGPDSKRNSCCHDGKRPHSPPHAERIPRLSAGGDDPPRTPHGNRAAGLSLLRFQPHRHARPGIPRDPH